MKSRTITFRSIFITLCILMVGNICVNLFTGSTEPVDNTQYLEQYDQDVEKYIHDFQVEITSNGDYIIYQDGDTPLGVVTRDGKCTFKEVMVQYMEDHD